MAQGSPTLQWITVMVPLLQIMRAVPPLWNASMTVHAIHPVLQRMMPTETETTTTATQAPGRIARRLLSAALRRRFASLETVNSARWTSTAAYARNASEERACSRRVPRILRLNVHLPWEPVPATTAMAQGHAVISPANRHAPLASNAAALLIHVLTLLRILIPMQTAAATATNATVRVSAGGIIPDAPVRQHPVFALDQATLIVVRRVLTPLASAAFQHAQGMSAGILHRLRALTAAGYASLVTAWGDVSILLRD